MRFRISTLASCLAVAAVLAPAAPAAFAAPTLPPAGTCSFTASAVPAQAGFPIGDLAQIFPSDLPARGTYVGIIDAFSDLRSNHPDVMRKNMDTVVAVNHSAAEPQQQRAIVDHYEDRTISMADGLGAKLGAEFLAALNAGQLPKVAALIKGDLGRAGGAVNSSFIEKEHFSNPRPYIAAPERIRRYDRAGGDAYSTRSGSFPSGHSNQAYWKAGLLASWLPEVGPQILARASEVGDNRLVMGVHYPLDVIGGRMTGLAAAADRLADPRFAGLLDAAGRELRSVLEARLGTDIPTAVACDRAYLPTSDALSVYRSRMTYGFDRIGPADAPLAVPAEAASLLRAAHPDLTDAQRIEVLRLTAIPSGYPLDKHGESGGWQRLDLAAATAARATVGADGTVRVTP